MRIRASTSRMMSSVKSRRAWPQYLNMTAFFAMGSLMLWVGVSGLIGGESFWLPLGSTVMGLVFLEGVISRTTRGYEVTPNVLVMSRWKRKQPIEWERITKVNAIPTFFGQPNLLITKDGKGLALMTSYFANGKLLNQAIIEGAFLHNPSVKINELTLGLYGNPPYRIFADREMGV